MGEGGGRSVVPKARRVGGVTTHGRSSTMLPLSPAARSILLICADLYKTWAFTRTYLPPPHLSAGVQVDSHPLVCLTSVELSRRTAVVSLYLFWRLVLVQSHFGGLCHDPVSQAMTIPRSCDPANDHVHHYASIFPFKQCSASICDTVTLLQLF